MLINMSVLKHSVKDETKSKVNPFVGSFWIHSMRVRNHCSKQHCLLHVEGSGWLIEVGEGSRLNAINAIAPFNYVEINFQNTPFGKFFLQPSCYEKLFDLAERGLRSGKIQIFCKLLGKVLPPRTKPFFSQLRMNDSLI
jgi:hypothetical protein